MKPAKIFGLVIVLISAILVYFMSSKKGTLEKELKYFVVEDTASINKIKVSDAKNSLILERQKSNWKINNSYTARNEAIYDILKIFNQLQIQSTVPNSALDSVEKSLKTNYFQLELSGNFIGTKTFKINNLTNKMGSYFWSENSESPLILYVPGMNKNLAAYFSTNPAFWRSKTVIDYLPNEIKSVELSYPAENEKSFRIINNKKIEFFDFEQKKIENFNREEIQNYLSLFRKIEYKNLIENTDIQLNTFDKKKIYALLTLIDSKNTENTLKLYQKLNDKNEVDLNVLYAIQNNEILFEISYFTLDPILKEKNNFTK